MEKDGHGQSEAFNPSLSAEMRHPASPENHLQLLELHVQRPVRAGKSLALWQARHPFQVQPDMLLLDMQQILGTERKQGKKIKRKDAFEKVLDKLEFVW